MVEAAGLLPYRKQGGRIELFLTHPGGPFWAKKDAWSITKGELDEGEDHRQAMEREFLEETGFDPPLENHLELGHSKEHSGKINHVWAVEADFDLTKFHCDSMVHMPWPPKSEHMITFPENDRATWMDIHEAHRKVFKNQRVFIERLAEQLGVELRDEIDDSPAVPTLF